ncbi:MAG: tRNA lysidine(34) synthetase TilS, partial [Zetaproteobacteria bacterium]|nr:tRNA lysidine(34) synthetase TilS [Zetaproteobacteria bacterium]
MSKFDLCESVAWLQQSPIYRQLPQRLAVAWSGGIDSTLLLLTLKEAGFTVFAWHVDHAWHGASAENAKALELLADAWAIPFVKVRLSSPSANNREANARSGRYQAFVSLAKSEGVDALCLGHHANDQAESVCMRMLQASGVKGLQGMHSVRAQQGLSLYRPWLHVPRQAIERVLHLNQIPYIDDPSNEDVRLWRNHIRKSLFPAMFAEGVDPLALFQRWQLQAVRVGGVVSDLVEQVNVESIDPHQCAVLWKDWNRVTATVRIYLLQTMFTTLLGEGVVPGRRHLLDVESWTQRGGLGGLDLSRCRLQRKQKRVVLL